MRGVVVQDNHMVYLGKFNKKFSNSLGSSTTRWVDIWLVYHKDEKILSEADHGNKSFTTKNVFKIFYFSHKNIPKIIMADEINFDAYSELQLPIERKTKVEFSSPRLLSDKYKKLEAKVLMLRDAGHDDYQHYKGKLEQLQNIEAKGKTITFSDSEQRTKFIDSLIEKITRFIEFHKLEVTDIAGLEKIYFLLVESEKTEETSVQKEIEGYLLFSKENWETVKTEMGELKAVTTELLMAEVAKRWNQLPEDERDTFNERAKAQKDAKEQKEVYTGNISTVKAGIIFANRVPSFFPS